MEKFVEQLRSLAKRVETLKASIETEEATKTAIVMPFFQILGYDIFNPLEFTPEFTADVGIKKGEKVDYAILHEGYPVILIECKSINQHLTKHDSQLFRYFGTTTAKFSILTNGIEYKFFTDLEEPNKMDSSPFFSFKINELRDVHIAEISKFRKEAFDVDKITSNASELKYLNALKSYLVEQFENPSEDFVRYLVGEIYEGVKTKAAIEKFTPIVKRGIKQIVNEQVNDKLNAALKSTSDNKVTIEEPIEEVFENDGIITTNEELECYAIVKVALKDSIELERVFYRDNRSYFNILIDNNIRKWVMRVFFDRNRNYIILNDAPNDKERTLIEFSQPIDLLMYQDKIITTASLFK
ncbi:type I restriction endonuclease [Sporosarcina luteola]|nr:type I restriction endonuclease [Sporosarcina luteola]MCM3744264.1 type I restriction endonuclease [Sporosarcina luteola]